MRDGAIGAARTSSPRRERHVCLQVEDQRKDFVDPPHLIDGQEADRLDEAVEIDGRKLVLTATTNIVTVAVQGSAVGTRPRLSSRAILRIPVMAGHLVNHRDPAPRASPGGVGDRLEAVAIGGPPGGFLVGQVRRCCP